MKVAELFEYVDEILENAFTDKTKRRWLNQIEAEIQVDVLLTAAEGVIQYGEGDNDAELIAPPPYDQLYHEYLFWQICLAQQEVERANNYAATFNRAYNEYVRFVAETINPGCGMAERMRYYLTAYQIAVKHGFSGSEIEWLQSLKGPAGEPFRYEDFTKEQLEGLRGPAGIGIAVQYDPENGRVTVTNAGEETPGETDGNWMDTRTYDPDETVAAAGGIAAYVEKSETWTFVLKDGTSVIKEVRLK